MDRTSKQMRRPSSANSDGRFMMQRGFSTCSIDSFDSTASLTSDVRSRKVEMKMKRTLARGQALLQLAKAKSAYEKAFRKRIKSKAELECLEAKYAQLRDDVTMKISICDTILKSLETDVNVEKAKCLSDDLESYVERLVGAKDALLAFSASASSAGLNADDTSDEFKEKSEETSVLKVIADRTLEIDKLVEDVAEKVRKCRVMLVHISVAEMSCARSG